MRAALNVSVPTLFLSMIGLRVIALCKITGKLPKASLSVSSMAFQDSRLVLIEDAGHMVMIEKPEEVGRAIEAFVRIR